MARFELSPARLARFVHLECERFLRFDVATAGTRSAEGLPSRDLAPSSIRGAVESAQHAWADDLVRTHLAGRAVLADAAAPDTPTRDRRLGTERTLRELRALRPGRALFQPTLAVPDAVGARYGLDPERVALTDACPDLVLCVDGAAGPELRIVAVRASEATRLADRVQVAYESVVLAAVCHDAGLDDRFPVGDLGGVWLPGRAAATWFAIGSILPPIETYLADDLPPLLAAEPAEAFWHLAPRCEWCDLLPHCRREAEDRDDLSLVPYLTHFGKRHLRDRGLATVAELAEALEHDDADEMLRGAVSLEGRREQLATAVAALQGGEARLTGAASVALPAGEGVRLVLTLQRDPRSGELAAYAIDRRFGGDVLGSGHQTVARVADDGSPAALARLRSRLTDDLLDVLLPVAEHNRGRADDWWDQLSVQAYVYDPAERDLLVAALLRAVDEAGPERRDDVLALAFHFQHPDLAALDEQPAKELVFPVVVLSDVVRQVLALPVPVTYRFADVNAALQPAEHGFGIRVDPRFDRELGNEVRPDAVLAALGDARPAEEQGEALRRHLRSRVWGANSILVGLRERLGEAVFAYPPKLELAQPMGFRDPLLSRLAFITRYESVLAYLETRGRRMRPEQERLARGDALELTAIGDGWFRLHPRHDRRAVERGFWDHLLTTDDRDGRRARLQFDDHRHRATVHPPGRLPLALATVREVHDDGRVRLDTRPSTAFREPQPGERCLLERRHTDWTTRHLEPELRALDEEHESRFARLLDDPVGARRDLPVAPSIGTVARALANQHGMTPSQRRAFAGLVSHDTQLVWGPPGTGKTHFLALAVLTLAEAHRRNDAPFTVLVTAFTHTAIDALLRKVAELQDQLGVYDGDVPIRKLATYDRGSSTEVVTPNDAPAFVADRPIAIVGGTVWQVRKVEPSRLVYDLVVVDEASQVRVAEAAIPVRRLAPEGRLLIAGDDRQLPPIVAGSYPEPPGEPLLHRSILACLRDRAGDRDDELTAVLTENWRMNAGLCTYPAASLYPSDYAPVSEEVRRRRLVLPDGHPDGGAGDQLVDALLDPQLPLAVAVLEDVVAASESPAEAELAAAVTLALRAASPDRDDRWFRDERLFVVSPHHAQARAIRRELTRSRSWDVLPFVDTIDRAQGQERDAVVVSYGVADVELALQERDFIYSPNRLNVAVTRARSKAVVLLSRRLLDPPVQALADERVAEGIAFMQGLVAHAAGRGSTLRLEHPGVGRVTVVRA